MLHFNMKFGKSRIAGEAQASQPQRQRGTTVEFSEYVKKRMKDYDLNVPQLAEALNVGKDRVYAWVNGRDPKLEDVRLVTAHFQESISILDDNGPEEANRLRRENSSLRSHAYRLTRLVQSGMGQVLRDANAELEKLEMESGVSSEAQGEHGPKGQHNGVGDIR